MKPHPKGPLVLSLLIIVVGVGWLLTAKGIAPTINWVWTLGLGAAGIVVGGLDKVSLVVGMFFIVASVLSHMRQIGSMAIDTEVPTLVITVGVLLLIAQAPFIPRPKWFVPLQEEKPDAKE